MENGKIKTDESLIKYAGFGLRLYAQFLDFLILCPALLPYGLVIYYHNARAYSILPYYTAFHSLLYIGYRFFFHAKFGRTLGKKWAGILVVNSGNEKIGWAKSFSRIFPELLLSVVTIIKATYDSQIYWTHLAEMQGLPWAGVDKILRKFNPIENFAVWDSIIYYSVSILFIVFSRKKRALHDFLADSRVVLVHKK